MKKIRTTHKKLLSLLLVMIMLVSIAPANLFSVAVNAIDGRVEQAVQTAVAIANDNSHGYSQSSRQGPDYDCSSLVYYAFSSAGFSLSPTWFSTRNMGSALINAGFVELTNIDLSNSNSLQRGDILWKEGHTEIYIGNNQLVGAHSDRGYPQTGDQPGNEISVEKYYYKGYNGTAWTKVYRYSVPDTSKPTGAWIWSDKTLVAVGEEVKLNYNAVGARTFVLGTYYNDELSIVDVGSNDWHTVKYDKPGKYYIHAACYNSLGYCDSNQIVIEVYDSKPSKANLTINKKSFVKGETILFSSTSDYGHGYTIGIDKYNDATQEYERIYTNDVNASFEYISDIAGEYSAYVTAWNIFGTCDSQRVYFSVGIAPQHSELNINKSNFNVGEKILFKATSDYAHGYAIGINKYNDSTEKYERIHTQNITGDSFEYTIDTVGKYCAYVTAWNEIGGLDSEKVVFTVGKYSVFYFDGQNHTFFSQAKYPSIDMKLSDKIPTYDGYNFLGWSTDKNATEPEYLPGDTYSENKDITLYAVWEEAVNEYTIVGEIKTSGNSNDEILIDFYKPGESDSCGYTIINGEADGFSLGGIQQGEYIIKISKPNHVTREYRVVVDKDIELDIQLNLIGDVSGDGKINVMDYSSVLRHAKKTQTLEDYAFLCADVDGNSKVTVSDYARILRHVKKTDLLW